MAQGHLFGERERLCRACKRVPIVVVPIAGQPEKKVPLDTRSPVYRLEGGQAVRCAAYVTHWASCRSPQVAAQIRDGIVPPSSWSEVVIEIAECLGLADPFLGGPGKDGVDAAVGVLTSYFGSRPPGAPTPPATTSRGRR